MKKGIITFITSLCVLVGFSSSCKEKETEIPFVQIGKGILSGSEGISTQDMIITTQEEWENLKTAMRTETNNFSETEIDFDKYSVVAVFDKVHYSGSYEIAITKIIDYSDKVVVTVKVNIPKGIAAPQVITQPYHIVKTPILTKSIEFKHK